MSLADRVEKVRQAAAVEREKAARLATPGDTAAADPGRAAQAEAIADAMVDAVVDAPTAGAPAGPGAGALVPAPEPDPFADSYAPSYPETATTLDAFVPAPRPRQAASPMPVVAQRTGPAPAAAPANTPAAAPANTPAEAPTVAAAPAPATAAPPAPAATLPAAAPDLGAYARPGYPMTGLAARLHAAASPASIVPAVAVPPVPNGEPTPSGDPDGRPTPALTPRRITAAPSRAPLLAQVRVRVQDEVIRAFESLLDVATLDEGRRRVLPFVDTAVTALGLALTRDERMGLVDEVVNEIMGLGPLEPLLRDPSITEIMVNGPKNVYIERKGRITRVDVEFVNNEHVARIIDRIIRPIGRRIDETSPRVDARLPDGSRVNAIIPPLSLIGPVITIRRFSTTPFTVQDLIGFGTATGDMFEFIRCCVQARLNIFVSGGTGSGKTTLLNVLSSFIPETDRIVTVEDAAELQLRQEHVVTLEARPANAEGSGEITIRDLLRNALHMRPDRLIVGECRSGEALDMIQAMTTGHDGSLSTGHANSARDMLRRLETMVLMTGYELPMRAIREQIVGAVDLIVHTARLKDGSRKILNITEVYGIEDDEILTQDIFEFEQTGLDDNGRIQGRLRPTGVRPHFMHLFSANGVQLPEGDFGIPPEDPSKPVLPARGKGRWGGSGTDASVDVRSMVGSGRAVVAGGMVYVSSIGPLDMETGFVAEGGIREHARRCMENLAAVLEANGSSLERVVWANWALRDLADFDTFSEEWHRWYPADPPVGQTTIMPIVQRRAGFRVSIGVIAEA